MFNFIIKGGPVMIPIILGSMIGLAIVLERLWVFRQMLKLDAAELVAQVLKSLKHDKIKEALEFCNQFKNYPVAAVFKVGIEKRELALERLEKVLEQEGNNQVHRLEKNLGGLVSVVSIEPLLGFLGTITGLIKAFMSWENAGANVTVSVLAAGMYEAMITTAAGLIIAIPLFICYNYFISKIKNVAHELTNYCVQLLEYIGKEK